MTYSEKIKEWADAQGDPIRRQFDSIGGLAAKYANGETFDEMGEANKRGNWVEPVEGERQSVLDEAKKIIGGARQDSYGSPEDSFQIIASYWNTYIAVKVQTAPDDKKWKELLDEVDVCNLMVLFKQARKLGQKPCRDNYVDSIGYEAIAADRLIKWGDR